VIKVKNNIKFNKKNKFFLINISIIIHFGKNPKKGGKPPKDNKTIKIEILKNLFELNILNV
jgi:hypothetical protein